MLVHVIFPTPWSRPRLHPATVLVGDKLWLLGSVIVGIGHREFELQMIDMKDFSYARHKTTGTQPHDFIQRGLDWEALPWKDGVLVFCLDGIMHLSLTTFEWKAVFPAPTT